MRTQNIFILILTIFITTSCGEDWLKPEPLSFYAPENVYVDEKGAESILVVLRRQLREEYYGNRNGIAAEMLFTEIAIAGAKSRDFPRDMPNQITPAYSGPWTILAFYEMAYNAIRSANVLTSRIDEFQWPNEDIKDAKLAEAYFHRAYWYYRLTHQFGDVPYIDYELTEPKLDFYTHSRWPVLERVKEEMEFAVEHLPIDAPPGAITRGAGNHLLTKIYLALSEFDKAIISATRVIDGNKYKLETSRFGIDAGDATKNVVWDLHRPANKQNNSEAILVAQDRYDAPDDAKTGGSYTMRNFVCGWAFFQDSQGKRGTTNIYDTDGGGVGFDKLGPAYGFGNANTRPSPYAHTEIWTDPNDLRRSDANWVNTDQLVYNDPSSVDFGKPLDPKFLPSQQDTIQKYFPFPRYKVWFPEADPTSLSQVGGNGDMYIFRLAETYLLRAEAYFWKGNLGGAATDINAVRARSNAAPVSTADVTIGYILDERARELFMEEPRKTELTRIAYIMAANNIDGYSLSDFSNNNFWYDRVIEKNVFYRTNYLYNLTACIIKPYIVLWPVPSDAINSNSLGHINQNEGYFGSETNIKPLDSL